MVSVSLFSARFLYGTVALGIVILIGCGGATTPGRAPDEEPVCAPRVPGPAFEGHALQIDVGGSTNNIADFVVGYEFASEHEIEVTHLGVLDQNGNGVLDEPLAPAVGLWGVNGALLADAVVPLDTVSEAGWFYVEIAPVPLPPGNYVMGAVNYTAAGSDQFWFDSAITTAPGISVIEGRAIFASTLTFPDQIIRSQPFSYFGPGFKVRIETLPRSVQLTQPSPRAVFQRDATNLAVVPIEGTVFGSVCRIEARAVARSGFGGQTTDWVVVDAEFSGGALSTSLTVSGGWYDIEVRIFGEGEEFVEAAVERVGVGEVFLTAGQSNSANHGAPPQAADDERVCAFDPDTGAWRHADDPQPYATGAGGSPWPQLGDLLALEFDVPIGFVSVGVGATQVAQWDVTAGYVRLQGPLVQVQSSYGVRAILWHQGESDSLAGTGSATYAATLERIIAASRTDAGFDVPWFVALASWHPSSTAANEAQVIGGQTQVIAGDPLVFQGSSTDPFHLAVPTMLADSVHFNTLGLETHAMQWFDALVPLLR